MAPNPKYSTATAALRRQRKTEPMNASHGENALIFTFRMLMGWTFLYAASHQVFDPHFSITAFLSHTKTFHDVFAVFAAPAIAPAVSFLVAYGHLLIGLSLL